MPTLEPTAPGDPLDPVVADYLQQVETGKSPNRDQLLAMHPDLADRLRAFFADLDRFGKQASAFRLPNADSTVASDEHGGTNLPRVRYIGDYELLEEIARGGMGIVYKARQVSLNRVVALKMILAGTYATPAARQRFTHEAEAAAGLDHPNILPIYEVGEHEGHDYFSMKLVDCPRTDVRGLSTKALTQVARAVHYAHQRGILHRDLKPSNILIDHDGTPYVTDFGLAKKVDADDGSTRTGAVVGTPAYMAPEQARGEKGLSTAADVYSLGAILYETLTGRPPFRGDNALDTLRQVTDSDPDHPKSVNPEADRDLAVIALKCLEKDPAKRYPSAATLADDLDRWERGEPIEARPTRRRERVVKWVKRNPLWAALIGLAAVSSVVVVTLFIVAVEQWGRARFEKGMADAGWNSAIQQTHIAEERLWASKFEQARAERLSGNRWRALELVAEARQSKTTPELEREAAQAVTAFGLRLVSKTPGRGLNFSGGDGPFVAFTADGSLFAVPDVFLDPETREDRKEGVSIHETLTGRIVARIEGDYSGKFAFLPAGPALVIGRKGRIIRHDVPTGTETDLGPGRGPLCLDPAGRSLAVAGDRVVIHDLAGGPARTLGIGGEPLAFAPNGLLLRSSEERKWRYHLWDLAADRSVASSPAGWRPASVDPQARWAVLHNAVWDLRAGKLLWPLPDLKDTYYQEGAPFSPTEPLVAYERAGNTRTIELLDLTTGKVRDRLLVPGHGQQALMYGRFRPDGTVLSVESDFQGDVTLWEVGTGRLLATLPDHTKAHWSPDGRHLVAFSSSGWVDNPGGGRSKGTDSHVRVYEVAALPARARLDRPINRLSFNDDGTWLAAGNTVWRVTKVDNRPRLVRATRVADKYTTFFDPSGGRWSFPLGQTLKPDTPFALEQVAAHPRTIAFPGRPHTGFDGIADAGRIEQMLIARDRKRAILIWSGNKPPKKGDSSRTPWAHIEAWELDSPKRVGLWAEGNGTGEFQSLALSPDETRLAAAGNRGLQVWDTETGKRLTPDWTPGRGSMRQVTFTADSRHIIAGYDDGWVALLQLDGQKVAEHQAHEGDLTAIAVSPDGRFAVSAADDRMVTVWDAKTLTRLAQWVAAEAKITAVTFAPDGRTLAIGDAKGVVQVWDVPAVLNELAALGFKKE